MSHCNRKEAQATDRFEILGFHHLEYYCTDAKTVSKALRLGLGMNIVAQTGHETGNHQYAGYVLKSREVVWSVVSPYLSETPHPVQKFPHPSWDGQKVGNWVLKHGTGVAVIAISVKDAREAFEKATGKGEEGEWAKPVTEPTELKGEKGTLIISEIEIYDDTIMRFVQTSEDYEDVFFPGYSPVETPEIDFGISLMDHVVSNTWDMTLLCDKLKKWLGLHTFAAFTKEDIKTKWTSLNSEVLSNNQSTVLIPINEPAPGKKESQITEYLKHYNGAGVQHIALGCVDVLDTVEKVSAMSLVGGFELIPTPPTYYDDEQVKSILAEYFSPEDQERVKKMGVLLDKDSEGVLVQIFTKPLFDRPTIFVELIQRLCSGQVYRRAGCGGFGKGNFRALFESIERMQVARGTLLDTNETQ
eukprot:TRINITY_DN12694_c0_g1_i1.p1 TRINITY_DN12694_c0_g1~~TRINITY_DN12694_c0_g1_i1.p1  ORF type:complete len:415 (-),score=120.90 TRINITY_DN12694_c0_g1_i1:87-1331(-)